jgi:hypothetical protein
MLASASTAFQAVQACPYQCTQASQPDLITQPTNQPGLTIIIIIRQLNFKHLRMLLLPRLFRLLLTLPPLQLVEPYRQAHAAVYSRHQRHVLQAER